MPDPSDNFKVNLNRESVGSGRWPRRCGTLPPVQAGLVGLFTSGLMSLSILVTTIAYTIRYRLGKMT